LTTVVLLAGPPAAGKTTVARRVADGIRLRHSLPAVIHVEVDDLRHMIVGNGTEDPRAWLRLTTAVIDASLDLSPFVVVDGLFWEEASLQAMRDRYDVRAFALHADMATRVARDRERLPADERLGSGELHRLAEASGWATCERIDASRDPDAVALDILARLFR